MGCFVVLFALISPRLALFFIWLFSDRSSRAYDDWWLPFIGFFLLPWTTLAYAVMWSLSTNEVTGIEWFFVALAFAADLAPGSAAAGIRASALTDEALTAGEACRAALRGRLDP